MNGGSLLAGTDEGGVTGPGMLIARVEPSAATGRNDGFGPTLFVGRVKAWESE